MAEITIGHEQYELPVGMTYEEIAKKHQASFPDPIALVIADGKIQELFKKVEGDCKLSFLIFKLYTQTLFYPCKT